MEEGGVVHAAGTTDSSVLLRGMEPGEKVRLRKSPDRKQEMARGRARAWVRGPCLVGVRVR